MLESYKLSESVSDFSQAEKVSLALAKSLAIKIGTKLEKEELQNLIDKLFACASPQHTADGKTIITRVESEEIDKRFK